MISLVLLSFLLTLNAFISSSPTGHKLDEAAKNTPLRPRAQYGYNNYDYNNYDYNNYDYNNLYDLYDGGYSPYGSGRNTYDSINYDFTYDNNRIPSYGRQSYGNGVSWVDTINPYQANPLCNVNYAVSLSCGYNNRRYLPGASGECYVRDICQTYDDRIGFRTKEECESQCTILY